MSHSYICETWSWCARSISILSHLTCDNGHDLRLLNYFAWLSILSLVYLIVRAYECTEAVWLWKEMQVCCCLALPRFQRQHQSQRYMSLRIISSLVLLAGLIRIRICLKCWKSGMFRYFNSTRRMSCWSNLLQEIKAGLETQSTGMLGGRCAISDSVYMPTTSQISILIQSQIRLNDRDGMLRFSICTLVE